jgi:hypothetical protein
LVTANLQTPASRPTGTASRGSPCLPAQC